MDQFTESRGRISTTNDHKDWILLTDKILYNKNETERDENTVAYLQALKVYHVSLRTFCATKTMQIIYIIIYHLLFLVLIY